MRIKMPAVRIAQADVEMQEEDDVLTCGVCQKAFALGDIVRFIQHKVKSCSNKENYALGEGGGPPPPSSAAVVAATNGGEVRPGGRSPDRCSTPKRRPRTPPATPPATPDLVIKQEHVDSSTPPHSSPDEGPCKKLRTDAQSNTTNSEPSNYVCSTCKARMYSAWRLVQHVQNSHGIKIYVECSSSSSGSSLMSSPGAASSKTGHNSSSGSTGSVSSGPTTAPRLGGLTSPMVEPHLPFHNPFSVGGLMRLPLEHPPRQFPPATLATSLFARPSSHPDHFKMEQLVGEQFRLSGLGLPPPQFTDRPLAPPPQRPPVPPPGLPLSLEPQIDFYSQRLRQLAGTTSPNGAASPSPKKLSPPFTSPTASLQPPSLLANNNNNITTSNNNLRSPSRTESPKDKPCDPNDSVDLTSAPLSASTPPTKPDFTLNLAQGDDKIHPCEYCGKKFRFQSNLVVHRRSHTGEKPYKCSVCNHACSQSSKLKRHMKVHKQKKANGEEIEGNLNSDRVSNDGSLDSGDDVEEEDEDDLDEDEEEMEEEEEDEEMDLEEEDDDDEGDAPEDLTTKSASSTPPNSGDHNKEGGSPKPPSGNDKVSSGSLVGELMDKFGLSNIQQYSEAYKQALQESVGSHHIRKDDLIQRSLMSDNNNCGLKPGGPLGRLENGLMDKSAALRFREEFAKLSGQQPLDLVGGPHGLFGSGNPFEHHFDKRNKDGKDGPLGRLPGERDSLYAGLWLPAMAVAHHRESVFGQNGGDTLPELLKEKGKDSNPGTSASLAAAAAAAAALNLGSLQSQSLKKENRRNDTCEFCGKVFKNCSNLTVHRRSHTGEKPYKCELCSYACAQSSKLTRHMKTHGRMGKDVYRCRFCEMPFSVPSTLEKHMRKCVVNQNIKVDHMLPGIMSGDEDSTTSASKEAT